MPRYIVYKTTCTVNDKFYIGVHLERRISDGYIGCGVCSQGNAISLKKKGVKSAFIDSVIKYGYKNFKREIIAEFDNMHDAYSFEEKIVTKDLLSNSSCLNIKLGGIGGSNLNTSKNICIIDCETGEEFSFDSQASCASFLGLKNISGKKRFKNNKFCLKGYNTPVCLKNTNEDVFYFHDVYQAGVFTNNKTFRINDLLNKKRKSSNGWFLSDFNFANEKNYHKAKSIRKSLNLQK